MADETLTHGRRGVRDAPLSQRIDGAPKARTLEHAARLCDPVTPLDPEADTALRSNLDVLRGGDRLATIVRNIRRSVGTPTLHFLTGQIGSGKTTELLRMKRRLEQPEGDTAPHTVLYLDADAMLDRQHVELEDIVIALWAVVFRERPGVAATALAPVWESQIRGALAELVFNLPDHVPDALGVVLGQLRLAGIDRKRTLRRAVVLTALTGGLHKALREMAEDDAASVVVVIDNLEKLRQGQRRGVDRLYLERLGALKELDAHLVITVPLYLCHAAAGASLIGLHGGEVVVLPMVHVRQRMSHGGGDDADGLAAMKDVLGRRVDFGALFETGEAAAEEIARRSGGCIRHALRVVQGAIHEQDEPPVSRASLDRSSALMQADFERALPEAWVPILRAVAKDNRFPVGCAEEVKMDLLRHLFVLEYQRGEPDPWYAVHPLVERCRKYREHGQ